MDRRVYLPSRENVDNAGYSKASKSRKRHAFFGFMLDKAIPAAVLNADLLCLPPVEIVMRNPHPSGKSRGHE
jgi:hypothetical protein